MQVVIASPQREDPAAGHVEIVERKGIGHPDTICDAVAERLSVRLCRFYLERYGHVLHHNVDKALLSAGVAQASFGGGHVVEPWHLHLAGRAVTQVAGQALPVQELALEEARGFVNERLRAVNPDEHVRVHCLVQQGSADLTELFKRGEAAAVPLSNDTSFGVGYAPFTPLERLVLQVEDTLNSEAFRDAQPAGGEDVKVMGVRRGTRVSLTVARAFIGGRLRNLPEYEEQKQRVGAAARQVAERLGIEAGVLVNAADEPGSEAVYLTVTGTSAEARGDGQVGRGNRVNGLITPLRPMSLEAACGKNPVSHVGKLYNLAARDIAEACVHELEGAASAECYIVSQIGAPVTEPQLLHLRLRPEAGATLQELTRPAQELATDRIAVVARLWRRVLEGDLQTY